MKNGAFFLHPASLNRFIRLKFKDEFFGSHDFCGLAVIHQSWYQNSEHVL